MFMHTIPQLDNNAYVVETYEFANDADYNNTLNGGQTCNQIGIRDDLYKEDSEAFVLWLISYDQVVCFGRDQALFLVLSNDGKKILESCQCIQYVYLVVYY